MVGEIRDLETAEISVKAAQTGHMVLSTLHTNDAPTTLTRLVNMGIPAFNVASAVILITAQRLARRLCSCKKPADIPIEGLLGAGFDEADLDGTWRPYAAGRLRPVQGLRLQGPHRHLSGHADLRRDASHHHARTATRSRLPTRRGSKAYAICGSRGCSRSGRGSPRSRR